MSVLSKIDLVDKKARKTIDRFLEPDIHELLEEEYDGTKLSAKFRKLNRVVASVVRLALHLRAMF